MRMKKIVFTNGCFDILHEGHIKILEFAKSQGDKLIVGLNSDRSIRRIKGPSRPIVPESSRLAVLKSLKMVDEVILFQEETPLELIKKIKPDVLVKGSDYNLDNVVGKEFVKEVVFAPLIDGISTTSIINIYLDCLLNNS